MLSQPDRSTSSTARRSSSSMRTSKTGIAGELMATGSRSGGSGFVSRSFLGCVLLNGLGDRGQQHVHVAAFLERVLLDHRDLGDVLEEALEKLAAPLGVRLLAPAEHDRDLDLVVGAQEALDVALLGLVVVHGDLRPQLDLAD